jgi:hypothetical protein
VLLLLVVGRLALNPYIAWRTRESLADLQGYRSSFDDVSVSTLHLSYSVHGLQLVKLPEPGGAAGTWLSFYAPRFEIALAGREIVRRRALVLRVELDDPRLDVRGLGASDGRKRSDAEIHDRISKMSPRVYQRVEVKRAAITFSDGTGRGIPAVSLHDLDLAVENLATRVQLANGEPTTLVAAGTLQRTGQLSVFVTADPFARPLAFAGRAAIQGLDLRDLRGLLVAKAELAPEKGTIDIFAQFKARDRRITGAVKPLLKSVELKPAKRGRPQLKAWLADTGLRIFSDRVPGREAAASVIPIRGQLTSPKADLWTTLWGVLRNAFVAGLESGFANLQPASGQKPATRPQARSPDVRGGRR